MHCAGILAPIEEEISFEKVSNFIKAYCNGKRDQNSKNNYLSAPNNKKRPDFHQTLN